MKKNLYKEGYLQLRRNLLSQPEIVILLAEEGWSGVGLYVGINLYLSHCEAGWGHPHSVQATILRGSNNPDTNQTNSIFLKGNFLFRLSDTSNTFFLYIPKTGCPVPVWHMSISCR